MISSSLCSFVGYVVALRCVQGFRNAVEVEPLIANLLE